MPTYSIVTINPRTNRIIKKPKRYQIVNYAVRGPRGGITKLKKLPQAFFKGDLKGLNKSLINTQHKNFVLYEQLTRRIQRNKYGKKVYKKDGEPFYESKLTYAKPRLKQKPILFVKGRETRELDIGFKKGNYFQKARARKLLLAQPNDPKPLKIILKGKTIKEALSNLQVNMTFKEFMVGGMERGLYFNIFIKIVTPDGEVIEIPVADVYDPKRDLFKYPGFLKPDKGGQHFSMIEGKLRPTLVQSVEIISNLHSKMSVAIRGALKNSSYTFTSLTTLEKIQDNEYTKIETADQTGKYSAEFIEHAYSAADKLTQVGRRYVKNLRPLTDEFQVTLYISFSLR